ncbi:unnamed protein product [Vitrella brassicaformis CCMP3155]|uniref:Endonuclease/exonuclease/phosphatase domain-containing protein n=1 Tax=Vitrella brassicaformis (strain CCMP3155) TaxID=1169540 RepID=A0A0G4EZB8_VITBC|nr:unnamed protein product [Vitrella brassicaformis CCMP3155]|eukprot:CEM04337.1 unnamed protein product [Vitrella brassicaformis CCMP3155]
MSAKEEGDKGTIADEPAKKKARTDGGAESASASAAASSPAKRSGPLALTFLTWNIDVEDTDREERQRALVALIRKEQPDIVFLQEVTPLRAIQLSAPGGEHYLGDEYHVLVPQHPSGREVDPLNVTLVLKRSLNVIGGSPDTHWYRRGQIGKRGDEKLRRLCHVRVRPVDGASGDTELLLCNTHLDSGHRSNNNQFRREQLRDAGRTIIKLLDDRSSSPDLGSLIMAEDLNIRDEELSELPSGRLSDVYSLLGCPGDCGNTYVPSDNVNIQHWMRKEGIKNKLPPHRFDRVYVASRGGCQQALRPERMQLVGREKLPCGRHVSDHWGVMVRFKWGC